ncbi:MAG: hypothetical protein ACLU0O_11030 [Collinsella sp.]
MYDEESPRPLRAFLLTKQTPSEAERIEQAERFWPPEYHQWRGRFSFQFSEYLAADFFVSRSQQLLAAIKTRKPAPGELLYFYAAVQQTPQNKRRF